MEYKDYLIKYSEEFDRKAYEQRRQDMHKADYENPEGHNIHENGGPEIYADWLEDREKPNLAKLVRDSSVTHAGLSGISKDRFLESPLGGITVPHYNFFHTGGYDSEPHKIYFKVWIPSQHMMHMYPTNDMSAKEATELRKSLESEGVQWHRPQRKLQ